MTTLYTDEYYSKYYRENYFDSLHLGFGTEDILAMVKRNARGKSWLDLGSGPTSLFWATAMPSTLQTITISDISSAPHRLIEAVRTGREYPQAYQEALSYLERNSAHLDEICSREFTYSLIDAFTEWEHPPVDLITAFGLFGLAKSEEQLQALFRRLSIALAPSGVLMGASWIFSSEYGELRGLKNDFLGEKVLARCASGAGLILCEYAETPLPAGDNYKCVIRFVARRPIWPEC